MGDADLEGLFCDPDNAGFSFYRRMYVEVLAQLWCESDSSLHA